MKFTYIDTIDFCALEIVKENRLFYDPLNKTYYKLWKEDYVLWERHIGSLFLQAVNAGFYNGLADIKEVILSDNGSCIGYSMGYVSCPMKEIDGKLYGDIQRYKNKHEFSTFENVNKQNDKYKRFFKTLTENARKTGFFFYDLVQSNVTDNGYEYGIIDLESIANIRDFIKIPLYHLQCIPVDYYEFLKNLYNETITIERSGIDIPLIEKAWSYSTGGMNFKPYYNVTINGKYYEGERNWNLRWTKFKNEICWEGLKVLDLGTCMGLVPAYLFKYCGIDSATAIDFNSVHLQATQIVKNAFRIPTDKMRIIQIDLDNSEYENILGYDYDVVFCFSFLRWIKKKKRLLKYLSLFRHVFLEPHDSDGDVVTIFRDVGFNYYKLLGESRIGKSFPEKRKLYHFCKKP